MFDAPTTTLRERKQLIRAVINEVAITVDTEQRVAELRVLWQGGATTDLSMPMTKPGQHLRVTDEATVALVRRLAEHYDDRTIAAILAKQKRRTATGLPFTRARVAMLRAGHDIPVYQPSIPDVGSDCDDVVVVTITAAEQILGVSAGHLVPLDPRRIRHRRTDHPRRTLAHPYRPSPARSDPTRGSRRLARAR